MGFINPRVDIAFKKIFGVEENKDLLVLLINSVVKQKDQVKEHRSYSDLSRSIGIHILNFTLYFRFEKRRVDCFALKT